jgi:hypothetical protein
MDWAAQLLGLSAAFFNSSGIGGGVIQVFLMPFLRLRHLMDLDYRFGCCDRRGDRRQKSPPA